MLKAGMTGKLELIVTADMTAQRMKSGALDVFATPVMIAQVESCCFEMATPYLEPGQSTVGTRLDIAHLAATPVGMKVMIEAELVEVDRRRLVFQVSVRDEREQIGSGTHERFIVDVEKFTAKCQNKLSV